MANDATIFFTMHVMNTIPIEELSKRLGVAQVYLMRLKYSLTEHCLNQQAMCDDEYSAITDEEVC